MANVYNFPVSAGRIAVSPSRELAATHLHAVVEKAIDPAADGDPESEIESRIDLATADDVTRRATVRAYDFHHGAFAEACRASALAFMNGVAEGWSKRDLAMWLLTSYRVVACEDTQGARGDGEPDDEAPVPVEECAVMLVMEAARAEVSTRLLELREGEWTSVTAAMRDRHVEPLRSAGELVWVPVHRRRMRLADRVLSLFLVDYLHAADAYETDLAICASCARVAFDRVTCAGCARPIRSYLREIGPLDDAS